MKMLKKPTIIYISDASVSELVDLGHQVIVESGYSVNQNGIIIFITYLLVAIPLVILNMLKIKFDYSVFKY